MPKPSILLARFNQESIVQKGNILRGYRRTHGHVQTGNNSYRSWRQDTRQIQINAGVKQGCPLSPLLFNIVIDELIEKIEQKRIGVKLGDTLINIMAFADDQLIIMIFTIFTIMIFTITS